MTSFRHTLAPALLAFTAALPVFAQSNVPPVDAVGKPAVIRCGSSAAGVGVRAAHADKIIFRLSGALPAVDPEQQGALNAVPRNTELDIKVLDDPKTVADLRGKVLTFLGAVVTPDTRAGVTIIDVDYAMVCPAANP